MPRRSVRSRRRVMGGFLSFAIGLLALAAVALICVIAFKDRIMPEAGDAAVQSAPAADEGSYVDIKNLPESEMVLMSDTFSEEYLPGNMTSTPTPEPEAEATPSPAPMRTLAADDAATGGLPVAAGENMLPIFKKANTDAKVIAITLDECADAKLMANFVNMARHYDAKLTLFPTGEAVMRGDMGTVLKGCLALGYEIENRGYSAISRLYQYTDPLMIQEIWKQSVALNFVLGVKYTPHFFRMYGGLGENDPRTHAYLKQQGYLGIAHWTVSCTGMDLKEVPRKLQPGGIYAFRCSEEDGQRMYELMAAARKQGYRMVTLNQLFGFSENEFHQVSGSLLAETMPTFSYNSNNFYTLFPGDHAWAVTRLQQRLTDLGYMTGSAADGSFGDKTSEALRMFQAQIGMAASGAADVATQKALFAVDAPQNQTPYRAVSQENNPFEDETEGGNPFAGGEDEAGEDEAGDGNPFDEGNDASADDLPEEEGLAASEDIGG